MFNIKYKGVYESQIFHTKHLNILLTPPSPPAIIFLVEQYSNIYKETINKVHFILV